MDQRYEGKFTQHRPLPPFGHELQAAVRWMPHPEAIIKI